MTALHFAAPVLLVGAGPARSDDFAALCGLAGHVVAVDGGYDTLCGWGASPDAVLGDMDSIRAEVARGVTSLPITEQDSTDLEKALRVIQSPLLLGLGFLGGRLDHTLAAMHALIAYPKQCAVLVGAEDVVFAAPPVWQAALPVGTRVSFYPVQNVRALGSSGLRWPIEGLSLAGGRQIGVSNETAAERVEARFEGAGAVTIVPRACLDAVIDSLT